MSRHVPRRPLAAVAALGLFTLAAGLGAASAHAGTPRAAGAPATSVAAPAAAALRLSPELTAALASAAATEQLTVFFHADTLDHARAALVLGGLGKVTEWHSIDTVVGQGTAAQVRAALAAPGLSYAELNQAIALTLDTAHKATRLDAMRATQKAANGMSVDGTGVTIAIVDSGVDGTHPFFQVNGKSKVLRNERIACAVTATTAQTSDTCFTDVSTTTNNTDDLSAGGHGTHVSGIANGIEYDMPVSTTGTATRHIYGAAPGAREVMLSVGASESLLNTNEGFQWVIDHQMNPCLTAAAQTTVADPACPPIRVESNSFGPTSAAAYSPTAAAVLLQRQMVAKGVTVVYAAGNSGGTGAEAIANTNPPAQDPTGGIVMVAAYDDGNVGSPDNKIASYSSRGRSADPTTWPDISAPGSTITSSCRPRFSGCMGNPQFPSTTGATSATTLGDFQTISGTSMATPYIAGVVADIIQANPALTPAQVENVLKNSAHKYTNGAAYVAGADANDTGNTSSFDKGHGLVDVLAAVQTAKGVSPTTAFPAAPANLPSCGGLMLVPDSLGDAVVPVGPGDATSGDITSISFSKQASTLTTTLNLANLAADPGGANTIAQYTVIWDGPDGKTYATQANLPADPSGIFAYTVGVWDRGTATYPGATTTATGSSVMGTNGSVSVVVPLAAIGAPAIPVTSAGKPAVKDPIAMVVYGEGAATPAVTFTGIVDTAPDAGVGNSWSTCAAGGDPNAAAVASPADPVAPTGPTATLPEFDAPALAAVAALGLAGAVVVRRRRRGTLG